MSKNSSQKPKNPTDSPVAAQNQNMSIDQALAMAYGHWNAGQTNQAELLCQKVLVAWPGNSEALHLLGLMSHNWGNLDLAIEYLRKACQSPRAPAVYFSNLAEMCRQKGLLEEGESMGRRAVALDSSLVGGWNNLGIILQEESKYEEALTCLERVVAMQPAYAEAHNNLGNTFKKLGQLDKAKSCYTKALELAPNYPEAHSNLSNLLKEFGELDQAVASARCAIDLNPRLADAYINAAAAEMVRLRHEEALRWLNALLAFAPTNGLALAAKSGVLNKLDRYEEALHTAQQAVMQTPLNGDAHNAVGQVLQSLGRYDEALTAFEKAAGLTSVTPEQGFISKGQLLMEINRLEESGIAYAQALKVNPRSASAYFNAADLKTIRPEDPDIGRMEELLEQNQVQSHGDRMCLHYALGKAWMDVGDAKRAFAHLDEGSRMKRGTISYDAAATDRWLKTIAEAFPASLFTQSDVSDGASSDLPVFVIGMPRSGTTLVEQILASHPEVQGTGELSAMRRIVTGMRSSDGQPLSYPEGISALVQKGEAARIRNAYLAEVQKFAHDHKRIIDKMPANFLYAGLITLSMPHARIIHCRRDPVDTCLSCYTKLFTAEQNFTYDLTELGQFYLSYARLMEHWQRVLPPTHFIEVDYEAVVDDLETQAKRLVDFCGLQWDEDCLKFHDSRRPVRTASANQVRQPIYKRSVGRWKKYEPYLGPLLTALDRAEPTGKK